MALVNGQERNAATTAAGLAAIAAATAVNYGAGGLKPVFRLAILAGGFYGK